MIVRGRMAACVSTAALARLVVAVEAVPPASFRSVLPGVSAAHPENFGSVLIALLGDRGGRLAWARSLSGSVSRFPAVRVEDLQAADRFRSVAWVVGRVRTVSVGSFFRSVSRDTLEISIRHGLRFLGVLSLVGGSAGSTACRRRVWYECPARVWSVQRFRNIECAADTDDRSFIPHLRVPYSVSALCIAISLGFDHEMPDAGRAALR